MSWEDPAVYGTGSLVFSYSQDATNGLCMGPDEYVKGRRIQFL